MLAPAAIKRRFQLVLIKPSHYDDDGYVVQWRRSLIPSNSLSCVYALARDAADRCVLGSDVEMDISACDETNTRVKVDAVIDQIRRHDGFGMVGLVGVQSNQFPRAMDLARRFRAAGIPVVIGGFHVSGLLAMIPEMPPDLQEARRSRLHLVRGRSGRRAVRRHPARGCHGDARRRSTTSSTTFPVSKRRRLRSSRARPSRACSTTTAASMPAAAVRSSARSAPSSTCRDENPAAARADDVERLVKRHWEHGVRHFFITDDNFARNKDWEADLRPADPNSRTRQDHAAADHPGRHRVPQAAEFHREGRPRRRAQGLHRAREHQSRQSDRRQEAAEQDHRLPRDDAGLEERRA